MLPLLPDARKSRTEHKASFSGKQFGSGACLFQFSNHESTKGNGEKVARASFNGSIQGNHWCRGEHSLVPATSSALGRPSSCCPRHTLPLLAESSGSSKAQLQTGTSAVGWISHDTRPQHACHYAGTSRKAWHTPAGQLPPDQLWEDPSSGPPL